MLSTTDNSNIPHNHTSITALENLGFTYKGEPRTLQMVLVNRRESDRSEFFNLELGVVISTLSANRDFKVLLLPTKQNPCFREIIVDRENIPYYLGDFPNNDTNSPYRLNDRTITGELIAPGPLLTHLIKTGLSLLKVLPDEFTAINNTAKFKFKQIFALTTGTLFIYHPENSDEKTTLGIVVRKSKSSASIWLIGDEKEGKKATIVNQLSKMPGNFEMLLVGPLIKGPKDDFVCLTNGIVIFSPRGLSKIQKIEHLISI